MPIEITRVPDAEPGGGGEPLVSLQVIGTLDKKDFDKAIPQLEHEIKQHGKISMLIELVDFTGFTPAAAWEDAKFAFSHSQNVKNLAVVGERQWEEKLTKITNLLTAGETRFFEDKDEARKWVKGPGKSS